MDVDGDVEVLTALPQGLVDRLPQGREAAAGGHAGQQDAAARIEVGRGPGDLAEGVVDVVDEELGDARPPARGLGTEIGEPAVVGLDAGPSPFVIRRARGPGDQVALLEEGRNGVGKENLGGDSVGLVLGQPAVAVPAPVGGGGQEVGERIDVAGGPAVEVVMPVAGQVGPVVDEGAPAWLSAEMTV